MSKEMTQEEEKNLERAINRADILSLNERDLTFKLHRIIEVIRAAHKKGGYGTSIMFNKSCIPTVNADRACFSVPVSALRKTPVDMAWVLGHIQGTHPSFYV